jgi:anthranilate/para-aminobenzoate synthase component II
MTVRRNDAPVHGKTSPVHHDGQGVFKDLPNPFQATRYHSLIVDRATLGDEFEISAWLEDGTIMGLRSRVEGSALEGVQFHPESYLTEVGPKLLENFLHMT